MKLPRPRFRTIPTPVIIIIEAIFVFSHVRTDPDPYHSGFVYAQSIAVQNGLLPNVNFLSPYGLVGPLINGLWLKLTSDSLLSLLVFYGTITIVTGYLIQSSIRRYVPDQLAKLINLTWVVTLATAMPWPSILTTFLTLFAILQLLRNLERMVSASIERHYYVVPVVIALQLAVLTRIHLFITPFVISVFIIINRKKVNPRFVKTWLVTNIAFACFLTFLLKALGILMPFIDQAIIWPLTAFENPRMNFSFFFSFIWFPSALFILIALVRLVLYISKINKSKSATFLGSLFVLSIFYCLYYFSVYEFVGSRTNTLRTLPGFIKTASINFQHLLGYASAMAAIIGFLFLLLKNLSRGKRFESLSKSMEFGLMGSLGITGWIQLYPLHDNVHLWFVTPLFIVPAAYYLKESVKNISMYTKPLALVFSMFLIVQSYSFYSFLSIDRVPLSSSELQGMMASTQYRDTTDKTMVLLDKYISERSLRNNCKASLFSVSNRTYQSIDGNFSDNFFGNLAKSTPIVDPSRDQPEYVFECGINDQKKQSIMTSGFETVFEVDLTIKASSDVKLYNVLFRRVSTLTK